jgi:AcrR family transcriptional regulator
METRETIDVSKRESTMSEDEIIKERIFSTCQDRFLKEGFARISVDEITTDLAMSKKTFYKYFSSKEDLVQQIMERFMRGVRGNIERILLSDKSAVEKLSEIIAMIGNNAGRLSPAFGQDIQRRIPHLWKHIEEFRRQRVSEVFARLIAQGVNQGTMRPDMNARVFLMCVLGSIDRIMQPEVLVHESFSVAGAIQEIMGIFFRGALTQKGKDQFEELENTRQQST